MRVFSLIAALVLGCAALGMPIHATAESAGAQRVQASEFDFSKEVFTGGNRGWSVTLTRVQAGEVDFVLTRSDGQSGAKGRLDSVLPRRTWKQGGQTHHLVGKYGLAGEVVVNGLLRQPVFVLQAPSAKDTSCQDKDGREYTQAVFVFIGSPAEPLYGCGEFKQRP